MKILCIGHAAYDITVPVNNYPIENSKNRVTERVECGGGPASNAACLLAKWNMETYFAGVIGNDIYGNRILNEFNEIGVRTNFLEINKDVTTTSSFIIANCSNGSRTIMTYRPKDMKMSDYDLDIEPNVILVDGQELDASKKAILNSPRAISIIDAGSPREDVIELCNLVNYIVCSKDFAEAVSNIKINFNDASTLINSYLFLKNKFKKSIVITLEEKGCIYELNGTIKLMPSIHVKAIDSTGAGDIFHGAFAYGIANNFDIEKTLKYANIAGAISVTHIGGRYSIPSLEEVEKEYDALK